MPVLFVTSTFRVIFFRIVHITLWHHDPVETINFQRYFFEVIDIFLYFLLLREMVCCIDRIKFFFRIWRYQFQMVQPNLVIVSPKFIFPLSHPLRTTYIVCTQDYHSIRMRKENRDRKSAHQYRLTAAYTTFSNV